MRPVWGFDLDDVLCLYVPGYLEVVNKYFGSDLRPETLREYYAEKALGVSREDILPVLEIAWQPQNMFAMPAILEGVSVVQEAKSRGYQIHIVTARNKKLESMTKQWLMTHGIPYDNLVCTSSQSKSPYVQELGITHFVEDNPKHVEDLINIGIKVFVPKYPWNENRFNHPNVSYLDSLSDLICLF